MEYNKRGIKGKKCSKCYLTPKRNKKHHPVMNVASIDISINGRRPNRVQVGWYCRYCGNLEKFEG